MRTAWIFLLVFYLAMPIAASSFYVSPDGGDAASGTRDAPWQTLQKASTGLEPGDTVILLPGEYPGTWEPDADGTADRPITLRAETRRTAHLVGSGDDTHAVNIDDRKHIRVEGLYIQPEPRNGRWMRVIGSSNIQLIDCQMEDGTGGMPFVIGGSDQVRMADCVLRRFVGGNMARVANSTHVLIEGCAISRTGHSPLQFYPDESNQYVVIRGCVFHNGWGRNFEHFGTQDILFENNIITNALNGGRSADAKAKCLFKRGIFRFNHICRNWGPPVNGQPYRDTLWFYGVRLYNNVFHDNYEYGMRVSSGRGPTVDDVVYCNNIFSANDPYGGWRQVRLHGGPAEAVTFINNCLTADEPGRVVIEDYDERYTVQQAQSETFAEEHGNRYADNIDVSPAFVGADSFNYALSEQSPLRDAGRPLTTTRGSGSGPLVPVEDSRYFYDGLGIEGESGDLIVVGEAQQPARIIEVDTQDRELLLDRDVQWEDGDPVDLGWNGQAPDMGVYEHGDEGRASVQIVADPFISRPGQPITLNAVVRGDIDPAEFVWQFGYTERMTGQTVTRAIEEPNDYPIRLAVTDTDGNVHRATGYVVVKEPRQPDEPMLHSTFDADDENWWWHWQAYRPGPADYERVTEDGEGWLRIFAPDDRGRLPCWVQPKRWNIDEFPMVTLRYRIGDGTPVGLYLRAFGSVQHPSRRVCVAASPAAEVGDQLITDTVLRDDEQWHELTFDARIIRDRFPEVEVLEAMRFNAAPRNDVEKGMWFGLDEVIIAPQ